MSIFDVPRCEDCGISLDRHGEECGYYADEEYGNPEYGRPAGWLNAGTGEFTPIGEGHAPQPDPAPGVCCTRAVYDDSAGWWCPEHGDQS